MILSEYFSKTPALKILLFTAIFLLQTEGRSCTCPPTSLSLEETKKYELIFKGRVDSVRDCGTGFGEAWFKVEELFKGNATESFQVLFECGGECAVGFREGEEWIIYTRYKQIGNALMDWCSRSRKYFKHEKEDFYLVNYGNDYFTELEFLRNNLGHHRLLKEQKNAAENRNLLPDTNQKIGILLLSIAAIVLFYFLFRRFFR